MNLKDVLEKYITVVGVKDLEEVSTKRGYPLPKQVGSVVVRVSQPLFYHKGESTFEIPIYIDPNFTRAECGYWFPNVITYLGISENDIGPWIGSKFFEHLNIPKDYMDIFI
jgi:hypothetical protein